ncbi:MAG: hypothetical protein ACFB0E_09305 [Leptolyngbyaceae cyanobacterium]
MAIANQVIKLPKAFSQSLSCEALHRIAPALRRNCRYLERWKFVTGGFSAATKKADKLMSASQTNQQLHCRQPLKIKPPD